MSSSSERPKKAIQELEVLGVAIRLEYPGASRRLRSWLFAIISNYIGVLQLTEPVDIVIRELPPSLRTLHREGPYELDFAQSLAIEFAQSIEKQGVNEFLRRR